MILDDKQTDAEGITLELVWRNPSARVKAHLKASEKNNPYYRWAEHAIKIRARRSNWDAGNNWID